jgi:hypothetical protein
MARTGLKRFVGPAAGTPPQGNRRVADATGASRHEERPRLAPVMPARARMLPQEATLRGAVLRGVAPGSHAMLVAHAAQGHEHATGPAGLAQALAGLACQGMPATSEAAPGLLAAVAPPRGAGPALAVWSSPLFPIKVTERRRRFSGAGRPSAPAMVPQVADRDPTPGAGPTSGVAHMHWTASGPSAR